MTISDSKLSQQEQRRVGRLGGRVKSVSEFLSDAVGFLKDKDFPEAIARAVPWADYVTDAVVDATAEALPPVKFVVKLCEGLTKETDPELLGHLACTIAFERAVESAIKQVPGPMETKHAIAEAKDQLALLEPCEEVDIGTFSFDRAQQHEFFRRAVVHLEVASLAVGYAPSQIDQIRNGVQDRFVPFLKKLLAETDKKFEPFEKYITFDTRERQVYRALSEHTQYQRWLFEKARVFKREPFTLSDIYIETECGKLTWGEIKPAQRAGARRDFEPESQRVDPFAEKNGGASHLGCEFAHKSFREYFFAEAIVEALKRYGREARPNLPQREPYWKDFDKNNPRYDLSRVLARLFAPQWIKPEEMRHLDALLRWEIERAKTSAGAKAEETGPLTPDEWRLVRDGLADLWDWWGEGAHLRPQPESQRGRREAVFAKPFVVELIEEEASFDPNASSHEPESTVVLDAHLGDALCQLCALVHYHVAVNEGLDVYKLWKLELVANEKPLRKYQRVTRQGEIDLVLFAPGGPLPDSIYDQTFRHYMARINSAFGRPQGEFPSHVSLDGASLEYANLDGVSLVAASLNGASLNFASLNGASLEYANLDGVSLVAARLNGASLDGADLQEAHNLTWEQIDSASIDEETELPPEFEQQRLEKLKRQSEQHEEQRERFEVWFRTLDRPHPLNEI